MFVDESVVYNKTAEEEEAALGLDSYRMRQQRDAGEKNTQGGREKARNREGKIESDKRKWNDLRWEYIRY